jgi:hypothetical protein
LVAEAGTAVIRDGNLINLSGTDAYSMRDMASQVRGKSRQQRRQMFEDAQRRIKDIDQPTSFRSVYLPIVRDNLPRALEVFDFAEPTMVVGQRESSNTPDQGLYLLNNEFVIQQSDAMARRLMKQHERVKDQLENAFVLAYGRKATAGEMRATTSFYRTFKPVTNVRRRESSEFQKLSAVCQAIMASAEFRFLD